MNQQIPPDIKQAIKDAIATIAANTTWRIELTPEENRGGMRLGDKSYGLVNKVNDYMIQHPELVPAYIDVNAFRNDVDLVNDLLEILRLLAPITKSLQDTATLAGQEAMITTMAYYNAIKVAAKNNVPGAQVIYEDLKQRFASTTRKPSPPQTNP